MTDHDCMSLYQHGETTPWTCPLCDQVWVVRDSRWIKVDPPPLQPSALAPTLTDRIRFVLDDLSDLQREVEGLGHFLGADHAVNGLRQAQTYASDCLWRLERLAAKQSASTAQVPPFIPTGCDCDAIDGDHSPRCAIYVQKENDA